MTTNAVATWTQNGMYPNPQVTWPELIQLLDLITDANKLKERAEKAEATVHCLEALADEWESTTLAGHDFAQSIRQCFATREEQ